MKLFRGRDELMVGSRRELFRQASFRKMLLGQAVSTAGNAAQLVAVGIAAAEQSEHLSLVGLVLLSRQVPMLVLSRLAARSIRHRPISSVLRVTNVTSGLVVAVLTVLAVEKMDGVVVLVAASVVLGMVNSADSPARLALVGDLASPGNVAAAVSLHSLAVAFGSVAGPVVAAVLVGAGGPSLVFAANALSFFLAAYLFFGSASFVAMAERQSLPSPAAKAGFADDPYIRPGLLLVAVVASFGMQTQILALGWLRDTNQSSQRLGWILAGAGAAGVAGVVYAGRNKDPAFGQAAQAVLLCGTPLLAVIFSTHLLVVVSGFFISAFGAGIGITVTTACLQTRAGRERRKEVMAAHAAMYAGVGPMGLIVLGWGTDAVGARSTIFAAGCFLLAGTALSQTWSIRLKSREVRRRG